MRILIAFGIIMSAFTGVAEAQSKAELEEQRKRAMDDITYVDKMLKSTEKERNDDKRPLNKRVKWRGIKKKRYQRPPGKLCELLECHVANELKLI